MEFKRVTAAEVEQVTAKASRAPKEDKWRDLIEAVKETAEGEYIELTVTPIEGKELKRVARTTQQNIITAGKRLSCEVAVKLHKDYTHVYVTRKAQTVSPAPASADGLAVKFGNKGGKLAIVNLDEVKAKDEELHEAVSGYVDKPFGLNKGKLTQYLQGKGVAFVEVPKDQIA